MGTYKTLDPAAARKLIEGYEDVLTPEAETLNAFYRQFRCPTGCGSQMTREISTQHAFNDPDTLTARSLLRCPDCQLLYDPHSGLVLAAGQRIELPEN